MDYLQYRCIIGGDNMSDIVLNLVINGLPSIQLTQDFLDYLTFLF